MMRSILLGWLLMFVVVSLNGCVIVIGDDDAEGVHWASEYDEVRDRRDERAQQLLDEVRRSFDADELVRDEAIFIAARGGEVTLSGEASSGMALDRALQLASEIDDVESVVSRVTVSIN